MKRLTLLPLAALVLVSCTDGATSPVDVPTDLAPSFSSVHLKGGKNARPAFVDQILTLRANGDLSGLGGGDVFVGLSATADATAICTNPAGATQPPGQNPAPVTVQGGVAIPASEIKNGTLPFEVATEAPPNNPRAADPPECPNVQWEWEITDLAFTTATITVQQPQDLANPTANIVLTVYCEFSEPTKNNLGALIRSCLQS